MRPFSEIPLAADKPWLVIGKGPTFPHFTKARPPFHSIGLNHVFFRARVDVAHAIDLEVLRDVDPPLMAKRARFLLLPWMPHIAFRVSAMLPDLVDRHPVIRHYHERDRLFYYHLKHQENKSIEGVNTGQARYFSAEAVMSLLAANGVRQMMTCGIDGGTKYAPQFDEFSEHRLANGQDSFNGQLSELVKLQEIYNFNWEKL